MKLLPIAAMLCVAMADTAAIAAPRSPGVAARVAVQLSAQRKRPRIRITRQPPAWDYPRPGAYSWPGPNAVRQCSDWYVTEYRPSGTVITPQMRCRWVPG